MLREAWCSGVIDENTLVWGQGLGDWLPVKNVRTLIPQIRTLEGRGYASLLPKFVVVGVAIERVQSMASNYITILSRDPAMHFQHSLQLLTQARILGLTATALLCMLADVRPQVTGTDHLADQYCRAVLSVAADFHNSFLDTEPEPAECLAVQFVTFVKKHLALKPAHNRMHRQRTQQRGFKSSQVLDMY